MDCRNISLPSQMNFTNYMSLSYSTWQEKNPANIFFCRDRIFFFEGKYYICDGIMRMRRERKELPC